MGRYPPGGALELRGLRTFRPETYADLKVGEEVYLSGTLLGRRDLGGLSFLLVGQGEVRLQVVASCLEAVSAVKDLRPGDGLIVRGLVRRRAAAQISHLDAAGQIEITWREHWVAPGVATADDLTGARDALPTLRRVLRTFFYRHQLIEMEDHASAEAVDAICSGRAASDAMKDFGPNWFALGDQSLIVGLSPCTKADALALAEKLLGALGHAAPFDWMEALEGAPWSDSFQLGIAGAEPRWQASMRHVQIWVHEDRANLAASKAALRFCFQTAPPTSTSRSRSARHRREQPPSRQFRLRERTLQHAAIAEVAKQLLGPGTDRQLDVIEPILASYGMTRSCAEKVMALMPDGARELRAMDPVEFFSAIWSMLGNDNVEELLRTEAICGKVGNLVEQGVVTSYVHLKYLTPESVEAATQMIALRGDTARLLLRRLMTQSANAFASLAPTLANATDNGWDRVGRAVSSGVLTPRLFARFTLLDRQDWTKLVRQAAGAARPALCHEPASFAAIARQFCQATGGDYDPELDWELLFLLLRPVGFGGARFRETLEAVQDYSDHFERAGLRFGGDGWNPRRMAYVTSPVDIMPSKSRASFFSKATSGICTASDLDLFARPDHFHLVLYDRDEECCVGNVQLYLFESDEGRHLLVRGINPSQDFVSRRSAVEIVDAVVKSVIQLSLCSGVSSVYLCEGLGVWNADSARLEIRGVLDAIWEDCGAQDLPSSVPIFSFRGVPRVASKGALVWSA